MSSKNKPVNPHASAAGAYDTHARKHTPDQRELEARVLLKAAQNFVDLQGDWTNLQSEALHQALIYNRQIWMMFVDNAIEDKNPERPRDLRSNITNLGAFVFKHSIEVQTKPESAKLNILIEINREIAAGLMTKPKGAENAVPPPPAAQPGGSTQHSA